MSGKPNYLYGEITRQLWDVLLETLREVRKRPGYSERELCRLLGYALRERGLSVCEEVPVIHRQNGRRIGTGYIDLVLDCRVVVEVKKVQKLSEQDFHQLQRYVEDGGYAVGVLLNLGNPQAEGRDIFRRYDYPPNNPRAEGGQNGLV